MPAKFWQSSGQFSARPSVIWPFIAFPIFGTGNMALILIAILLGLVVHALMDAAQPAIMAEMFQGEIGRVAARHAKTPF
jgi:hypothetical protein